MAAFEILLNFLRCGARKIPPNTSVTTESIGVTAEDLLTLDQVRQLHVGLVHFLVSSANRISGLTPDGTSPAEDEPLVRAHLLLAKHFGWTPEQVSQLVRIVFSGSVGGLSRGSSVNFNGIKVGEVTDIRLAPQDPRRVLATIKVDPATPLRADTRARLDSAMLTGVSLHVPVKGGALGLGTWQGIYLVEHRRRPHRRELTLQFMGSRI